MRALVDFTQEHPDAGGATVTVAGQASWNKYVRKLDTTLDEWALGSKLGDMERPSFGVTGTNVSRYFCICLHISLYPLRRLSQGNEAWHHALKQNLKEFPHRLHSLHYLYEKINATVSRAKANAAMKTRAAQAKHSQGER